MALVDGVGYLASGIAEVAVGEAVFDVLGVSRYRTRTRRTVLGIGVLHIVLIHVEVKLVVVADGEVVVGQTRAPLLLVGVALIEVEVI